MKAKHALRSWSLVLTLLVGFSLSGCATESSPSSDPAVDEDTSVDESWEDEEPADDDWEDESSDGDWESEEPVDPPSNDWVCNYAPTMDNDWHNDVLCTNGTEEDRPYLREGDSFITQDEIMESAREYERQLNGQ